MLKFITEPPKSYTELISKLSVATFFTTFLFYGALFYSGYIPLVTINTDKINIPSEFSAWINWVLSFGVIPALAALLAFILSAFLELHNQAAKFLRIRYFWDKYFICIPLLNRAGLSEQLTQKRVKEIMYELYYPSLKDIDDHYTLVFWRYAHFFWILFEHTLVVLITFVFLVIKGSSNSLTPIFWYLVILILSLSLQLVLVTGRKSTDQAKQISQQSINNYFHKQ